MPDYQFEAVNGVQVKRVRVNRPKALCFDYLQLKDMFGLELETEVITDTQETSEDWKSKESDENERAEERELPF